MRRHAPGLDGLRALAVVVVVAYHLGVPGMRGGLSGVSVFFTLSGYLITSLLIAERLATGTVSFPAFFARRARRLLPAAWSVLVTVVAVAALTRSPKLGAWAKQAFFALVYVANWATIARGDDYFGRFEAPGPLDHLWSLAIEEQFYVLWPPVVVLLLAQARRRGARATAMLTTAALAAASTAALALQYGATAIDNTRAYEGTDTRAAALLVGALAAFHRPLDDLGDERAPALDAVGLAALAVIAAFVARVDGQAPFFYRGGELLLSCATATLVLAAAHPGTLLGRALGAAPLRWLGERSYGVYLWHMPVIALVPAPQLPPWARGALQVGLTVTLAGASHAWLEEPIRRRRARTLRQWATSATVVPLAIAALCAIPRPAPAQAGPLLAALPEPEAKTVRLPRATTSTTQDVAYAPGEASLPAGSAPGAAPSGAPSALAVPDLPPRTSCKTLIYVGDSTSISISSTVKDWIADPKQRLGGRLAEVGVELLTEEISGARSIVEKWENKPSAWEIVNRRRGSGYGGCWVFALGTNDPANVRGNVVALGQRIEWMMIQAEGRPVLWTTTKTLLDQGAYANAHTLSWTKALLGACEKHPNMRVYDWAAEVQDGWYMPDKIHPNRTGAHERARRMALALARAFPAEGPRPEGCLVRSGA